MRTKAAFRVTKNELGLQPVGHLKQGRVQAHILICFLGLMVWKAMELRLTKHSLGNSSRKVLEEFARWTSPGTCCCLPTRVINCGCG